MLVDENFKQRLRRLFSVMIPILITQTAIMAMNFFDSSMSGHAGAVDLAGTSIGGNIWMPIFVGTNGVLLGAMPIVAHLLGADKRDNIGKVIRHTIFLAIAFSAVIILMGVLFLDTLLTHLHLEPQVHYIAKMYMAAVAVGVIPFFMSTSLRALIDTLGHTGITMKIYLLALPVNAFLNYCFIFGKLGAPKMGVQGAALGTLLARIFEFVFICGYFFGKDQKIGYRIKDLFGECASLLREYIRVALPVVISDTLLALGNTAVAMVMGRIGSGFVSANSITAVIQQISTVLIQGICHAGCIITGHTLGRGEQERAQEQAWTFLWLGAIVGAAGAGIILLIRSHVIGLYNITPETKQIAWKLMDAIALIVVFQSVNGVMTKGVLRGGGDTRFLMVADVLFLWIVSVPLGALAGLYWHLDVFWIYVFLKLDQVIKAVWCVFRLKSRKWIKMLSTQLI